MSRVRDPRDEWSRINDLERRLAALERSCAIQGATMSAQDSDGNRRLIIGQIESGVWGIEVLDANGNDLTRLDDAGIHVYSPAGVEEVRAGKLSSGPDLYGLGVVPSTGTAGDMQQVGGAITAAGSALTNKTNTAIALSPDAVVTALVDPSGEALVTCSAHVATGASGQVGIIGISIDGSTAGPLLVSSTLSVSGSSGGVQADLSRTRVLGGLAPGAHTFGLGYATANNGAANVSFTNPTVTVQPL